MPPLFMLGAWFIDCRKLLLLLTMRLGIVLSCGRWFWTLFCICTLFTGALLIFTPLVMRIGRFCV